MGKPRPLLAGPGSRRLFYESNPGIGWGRDLFGSESKSGAGQGSLTAMTLVMPGNQSGDKRVYAATAVLILCPEGNDYSDDLRGP